MTPHVLPHDDGRHFWWFHDCTDFKGGREERETMLPLGPHVVGWSYDLGTDTVAPSILCHACGTHGYWERGEWRRVP